MSSSDYESGTQLYDVEAEEVHAEKKLVYRGLGNKIVDESFDPDAIPVTYFIQKTSDVTPELREAIQSVDIFFDLKLVLLDNDSLGFVGENYHRIIPKAEEAGSLADCQIEARGKNRYLIQIFSNNMSSGNTLAHIVESHISEESMSNTIWLSV